MAANLSALSTQIDALRTDLARCESDLIEARRAVVKDPGRRDLVDQAKRIALHANDLRAELEILQSAKAAIEESLNGQEAQKRRADAIKMLPGIQSKIERRLAIAEGMQKLLETLADAAKDWREVNKDIRGDVREFYVGLFPQQTEAVLQLMPYEHQLAGAVGNAAADLVNVAFVGICDSHLAYNFSRSDHRVAESVARDARRSGTRLLERLQDTAQRESAKMTADAAEGLVDA